MIRRFETLVEWWESTELALSQTESQTGIASTSLPAVTRIIFPRGLRIVRYWSHLSGFIFATINKVSIDPLIASVHEPFVTTNSVAPSFDASPALLGDVDNTVIWQPQAFAKGTARWPTPPSPTMAISRKDVHQNYIMLRIRLLLRPLRVRHAWAACLRVYERQSDRRRDSGSQMFHGWEGGVTVFFCRDSIFLGLPDKAHTFHMTKSCYIMEQKKEPTSNWIPQASVSPTEWRPWGTRLPISTTTPTPSWPRTWPYSK